MGLGGIGGDTVSESGRESVGTSAAEEANCKGFFCVCDGHGGHECSEWVSDNLAPMLFRHPKFNTDVVSAIHETIADVEAQWNTISREKDIDGGTTVLLALFQDNQLVVTNVGDSEGVLCRAGKAVEVSTPHSIKYNPLERQRLVDLGARIYKDRLGHPIYNPSYFSIAVTRAIGDILYKDPEYTNNVPSGLIPTPETLTIELTDEDQFLILACDGLWDVMSHQEACSLVVRAMEKLRSKDLPVDWRALAKLLATRAIKQGSTDNITVLIVNLDSRTGCNAYNNSSNRSARRANAAAAANTAPSSSSASQQQQLAASYSASTTTAPSSSSASASSSVDSQQMRASHSRRPQSSSSVSVPTGSASSFSSSSSSSSASSSNRDNLSSFITPAPLSQPSSSSTLAPRRLTATSSFSQLAAAMAAASGGSSSSSSSSSGAVGSPSRTSRHASTPKTNPNTTTTSSTSSSSSSSSSSSIGVATPLGTSSLPSASPSSPAAQTSTSGKDKATPSSSLSSSLSSSAAAAAAAASRDRDNYDATEDRVKPKRKFRPQKDEDAWSFGEPEDNSASASANTKANPNTASATRGGAVSSTTADAFIAISSPANAASVDADADANADADADVDVDGDDAGIDTSSTHPYGDAFTMSLRTSGTEGVGLLGLFGGMEEMRAARADISPTSAIGQGSGGGLLMAYNTPYMTGTAGAGGGGGGGGGGTGVGMRRVASAARRRGRGVGGSSAGGGVGGNGARPKSAGAMVEGKAGGAESPYEDNSINEDQGGEGEDDGVDGDEGGQTTAFYSSDRLSTKNLDGNRTKNLAMSSIFADPAAVDDGDAVVGNADEDDIADLDDDDADEFHDGVGGGGYGDYAASSNNRGAGAGVGGRTMPVSQKTQQELIDEALEDHFITLKGRKINNGPSNLMSLFSGGDDEENEQ